MCQRPQANEPVTCIAIKSFEAMVINCLVYLNYGHDKIYVELVRVFQDNAAM
jgi:hypothetical protein